ncbi:unnamed protein product [Pseudo-nitzschia multistriata]|uniref:Enoyl-CoA hydratase n=1 Tax=Pseudo-nitzschia multistriata TaxID=183589 RepID=A0A448YXX9_9STRA|nr:unnamed protein product [Pseudo-nitzschia multistriata]
MATTIKGPVHRFGRSILNGRLGRNLMPRVASDQKYLSSSSSTPSQVLMENIFRGPNAESGDDASCMVTKITLNRPKANAMGREMIQGLQNCLDILEQGNSDDYDNNDNNENNETHNDDTDESRRHSSGGCRCLVLTSFSDRVFSAGADLKERATMTQDEAAEYVTLLRDTMERFACLPMPVIAAIEGVAVGGGLELALAADIRVASSKAVLGFPETSLAIIPGAGGTQRLPRLVGASRAKELVWTGRRLSGREAGECGLVTDVVPEGGSATERALELAFAIAAHGPVAVRASKAAIDEGGRSASMAEALDVERRCYARVLPTEDRLEGLAAFREGRAPNYRGR